MSKPGILNSPKNPDIKIDRLIEYLRYDPETGIFVWLKPICNRVKAGAVAGTAHNAGYVSISFDGHRILAHRLAWVMVHGEWPKMDIDHENGDRADNRFANLREVTRSQNVFNSGMHVTNTSGYRGVSWHARRQKWVAEIRVHGKKKYLGQFLAAEDASAAYKECAIAAYGEFATRAVEAV